MGFRFRLMTFLATIVHGWERHEVPLERAPIADLTPALDALVSGMQASVLAERGDATAPSRIELTFFRRESGAIELMVTFRFDGDSQWRATMLTQHDLPSSVRKHMVGAAIDAPVDYRWHSSAARRLHGPGGPDNG